MAIISSESALGNPLLNTQHLIGASKWSVISDDEIVGVHQIRATHRRFADDERKVVAAEWQGHSTITMRYALIGGEWKLNYLFPAQGWPRHGSSDVFLKTKL